MKHYYLFLIAFISVLHASLLRAQTSSVCKIKPKMEVSPTKAYKEDYNLRLTDLLQNDRELVKASATNKVVVFHFYFDETNKFHKTAEDYLNLLKDSLKALSTDIEIQFKIQKTTGSIFINDEMIKFQLFT